MKLTVDITIGNAATVTDGAPDPTALADLLRVAADKVESYLPTAPTTPITGWMTVLRDLNGNTVGQVRLR